MIDLNAAQQDLINAEGGLSKYTADLPSQIKAEYDKAWSPVLQNAAGETQKAMSTMLPQYFGMAEKLGGTTAADLSPTQKLAFMGSELGSMGGRLSATQAVTDYLGGQMKDLYGQSLNAANLGQQTASETYARALERYKLAMAAAEAAKARAAASRGGGGGGGGFDWGSFLGAGGQIIDDAMEMRDPNRGGPAQPKESFSAGFGAKLGNAFANLGKLPAGTSSSKVNIVKPYQDLSNTLYRK